MSSIHDSEVFWYNLQASSKSSPSRMLPRGNLFVNRTTHISSRYFQWIGVFLFGLGLLSAGCEGQPVGSSCTSNDDCARGLFCDLGAPLGYCTALCSQALPCPDRQLCIALEGLNAENVRVLVYRCLTPCLQPEDCGTGLSCQSLSSGQQKVCFPVTTVP